MFLVTQHNDHSYIWLQVLVFKVFLQAHSQEIQERVSRYYIQR